MANAWVMMLFNASKPSDFRINAHALNQDGCMGGTQTQGSSVIHWLSKLYLIYSVSKVLCTGDDGISVSKGNKAISRLVLADVPDYQSSPR
jgi:hypothetical protein